MVYIKTDILPVPPKRVEWWGTSRSDLCSFPNDARKALGRALFLMQIGRLPRDWKPMRSVGSGVCEIRVHTSMEYRLMYVARFEEAIYVLHAFEKRSQKTSSRDIEIARRRLAEIIRARRERKQS